MFVFGSGVLIGTPQGGTPINFGLAQEVSLNIATTTKALYGQNNFPVAIGSGTRKMTGKAKLARISGQALGNLFFGVAPSAGGTQTQFGEAASVPASSPYTYSTRFHTTFVADQGVVYAASALPLKLVASAPDDRAIFGRRRRLHIRRRRRGRGGADLLHLHRHRERREHRGRRRNLIGPTITFSANLFASDPTTGQAVLGAALQLRRREAGVRHQARGLHAARARLPVFRQRGGPGLPAQLRRRGVSEETFRRRLAGRRWTLPHLPFRAIKAIQPALFQVYAEAGGEAITTPSVAALGEAQIERLAEATWRAIAHVDPALDLRRLPRPAVFGRRSDPGVSRPSPRRRACAPKRPTRRRRRRPTPGKSISTR